MRLLTILLLSFSFLLTSCLNDSASQTKAVTDSNIKQSVTDTTDKVKAKKDLSPPTLTFAYLRVKAKDLKKLITAHPSYKRFIFDFYFSEEEPNTLRLVTTLVNASRKKVDGPLFDLLEVQPNDASNSYPPVTVNTKIYFTQYELTNRQIRMLLNGRQGDEYIIFKPSAPSAGSYIVNYEAECSLCITDENLNPCPPFTPMSHE